jgi:5-methylcytosine-specific restriction endonuclease McrA
MPRVKKAANRDVYGPYFAAQRATNRRTGTIAPNFKHWYQTKWWKVVTKKWKELNPLCVMCKRQGKQTPVDVVDHKIPHKGNPILFFNWSNLQSLCYFHHNSIKQQQERLQPSNNDGW